MHYIEYLLEYLHYLSTQYLQYISIFLIIIGGLFFLSALVPRNRTQYAVNLKPLLPPEPDKLSADATNTPVGACIHAARTEEEPIQEPPVGACIHAARTSEDTARTSEDTARTSEDTARTNEDTAPTKEAILKNEPDPNNEIVLSEKTILYNDESGSVEYSADTLVFDDDLSKYEKMKRLAEGRAAIEGSGISLRTSQGFFRFSFDAFTNIVFGKNYVAVFIKSSESVKLLLFGEDVRAVSLLEKAYNLYLAQRIR